MKDNTRILVGDLSYCEMHVMYREIKHISDTTNEVIYVCSEQSRSVIYQNIENAIFLDVKNVMQNEQFRNAVNGTLDEKITHFLYIGDLVQFNQYNGLEPIRKLLHYATVTSKLFVTIVCREPNRLLHDLIEYPSIKEIIMRKLKIEQIAEMIPIVKHYLQCESKRKNEMIINDMFTYAYGIAVMEKENSCLTMVRIYRVNNQFYVETCTDDYLLSEIDHLELVRKCGLVRPKSIYL